MKMWNRRTSVLILHICFQSVMGLGWISPQGFLNVLVDQPFNLSCTLNRTDPEAKNYSSNDLMFYSFNDQPVSKESVWIINDTTILLNEQNAPAGIYQYICKVNSTGVDIKKVAVGYVPYNVSNFKCRSENWQKMNCSFEQAYNPIYTKYKLSFEFENSPGKFECPLKGRYNDIWECSIDMDSSYRQSHELYKFELTSTNLFGENREDFIINHFDNVIPEAPSECIVNNITSMSALLHWSISYKLQTFKRDFVFQVKFLSSYDNKNWKHVDVSRISKMLTNYTLPVELEYADTRYDVRIRMKTASAENIEEMWSNYSSCLFNTLPRKPDNPPQVAIGGFEINAYNDIFIYWKEMPKSEHNSATGFQYKVNVKRNDIKLHLSSENIGRNTSSMHQYTNMTDGNYTFIIHSSNSEGDSLNSSILYIPNKEYRISKPEITKLLSDSGKYLLSWKPVPDRKAKITSYTVFWCNSSSNSPNDCNGSIDFAIVQGDKHNFELSNISSTLNFAVAANSEKLSSGMVWASCTATQKNDIGKLKTIWIPAMQSTYIDLEWKLECGDSAIVEGYNIVYCPINSPRGQNCKENSENSLNITGTTSHRISGLRPYVTYKIQIAMYSKTRIGPKSDPLFNTTLEAAPSPPRDLTFQDVRNDSVTIRWKPPLQINGGKMNYEVWYNDLHDKVYTDNYTEEMEHTLQNLEPFKEYKIIVLAYTIGHSNASNSVYVKTEIGTPGVIQQPSSTDYNDTRLSIIWEPPKRKAGCIEYYELKIKTNKQTEENAIITRVLKDHCQMKRSICQHSSVDADSSRIDKYEFSVRAVNVILSPHAPNYTIWSKMSCDKKHSFYLSQGTPMQNNKIECDVYGDEAYYIDWTKVDKFATILYGQWSKPLTHWCNYGPENTKAIIFLTIIACSGIVSLSICTYLSLKKMKQIKNIKVVLPDALKDIVASEKHDSSNENGSFSTHDNFADLIGKVSDNTFIPFVINNEHREELMHGLDDTASLTSSDDNPDNEDEAVNESVLLSLSDNCKSLYSGNAFCESVQPIFDSNPTSAIPQANAENIFKVSPTGYVLAPVSRSTTTGYVQTPLSKPLTTNYIQPNEFTSASNAVLTKMPIVASTDAEGISGYVTHRQLSDYGHKMQ